MRETKETSKEKGITLIALVITIIVLLILAGISIAALTGNNGILTQAKLAKENTVLAKEQEEKNLDKINSYMNERTIKDNYTDINGDKATIPEGFTVDENENVISKGLVVHGPDKANGDNGSEFVWVPVPDINNMAQCSTAGGNCNLQLENGELKCITHNNTEIVGKLYETSLYQESIRDTANTKYDNTYVSMQFMEPGYINEKNYLIDSDYNNNSFTMESLKVDYKNMATSVAKYGGFYVGRYETSLSNATATEAKDGNVQSKQGVIPTSAENTETSTWYGLYNKQNKTYTGTNNSVESSMIWGSQYDRIINWVKGGNDEEEKTKLTNTELGNNSSEGIATSGNISYQDDNIRNIRDLGGNLFEWTQEINYAARIFRGGIWRDALHHSISYRQQYNPTLDYEDAGSRMTLYIK